MKDKILGLLYRSFDGQLTAEERRVLGEALAESEELRHEKSQIEAMRRMVASGRKDSFGPFFSSRVMRRVRELKGASTGVWTLQDWLARVFPRVAVAGAAVAIGLVVFNFLQARSVSAAAVFGISDAPIEEMLDLPVESIVEGLS
jgi:anti-sigma factor RsiW